MTRLTTNSFNEMIKNNPPGKSFRKKLDEFELKAWKNLYEKAPGEIAKEIGLKIFKSGDSFSTIISSIDVLAFNRIIGLGLNKQITDVQLKKLKNCLNNSEVKRFFIQLHRDAEPETAGEILTRNGFHLYNNWVKLFRDNSPAITPKTNIKIEQIDKDNSDIFSEIFIRSFELPDKLKPWISYTVEGKKPNEMSDDRQVQSGKWNHYLAFDKEKAIGTGMAYIRDQIAWIGFAGTLPEHRGKGVQSAMLSKRIEDCRKSGVKLMVIETAEDKPEKPSVSFRNVIKAGFKIAYLRPNFIYQNNKH